MNPPVPPRLSLLQRLDKGPVICAEGYVFELERRGYLQAGAFVPEVVLEHPEVVTQLHRDFVHAGSDIVDVAACTAAGIIVCNTSGPGAESVAEHTLGLMLSFLPDVYTTLWIGGIPYYRANDVYYRWRPDRRAYIVTALPPGYY